jgi:DNA mismatch repair ATPase MutL
LALFSIKKGIKMSIMSRRRQKIAAAKKKALPKKETPKPAQEAAKPKGTTSKVKI